MKKVDVRHRLLEAGVGVMHAKGFNATGVQELADVAGVPKGSFYNHFESKDAFAVEVVDQYLQGAKTLSSLSDESLGNPVVRLRMYFETMADARRTKEFRGGCLMGNFANELADQSRPVRDRLTVAFSAWARALEICIREAQRQGLVQSKVPAATLAGFLLNAWEGTVMRSKVDRDDTSLAHFMSVVFEQILV